MTRTVLEAAALTIGYRRGRTVQPVGHNLNVRLHEGELVCLLGPNGAGKSTLLRTLSGLQPPLAGRVLLAGEDLSRLSLLERASRLGVVLTERVEAGAFSARDVVALGRYPYTDWTSRLSAHDYERVDWAIHAVGAESLAARNVGELSDGERQKIMIARALAQEPSVIVLDEPTAFLDLPRRVEIMHLLRGIAQSTGRAILLSTHDVDLALRTADQMWLMADGKLRTGAPEDLILEGDFARAFMAGVSGAHFEAETGSFVMERTPIASVTVIGGTPVQAAWTRRAIERAGYQIADQAALKIEIEAESWRFSEGEHTRRYDTLYALVDALKAR